MTSHAAKFHPSLFLPLASHCSAYQGLVAVIGAESALSQARKTPVSGACSTHALVRDSRMKLALLACFDETQVTRVTYG
jgi:hypothetical protein